MQRNIIDKLSEYEKPDTLSSSSSDETFELLRLEESRVPNLWSRRVIRWSERFCLGTRSHLEID